MMMGDDDNQDNYGDQNDDNLDCDGLASCL